MTVHNEEACFQYKHEEQLVEKCYPYSQFNFDDARKINVVILKTDTVGQLSDVQADNIRKFYGIISNVTRWALANDEDVESFPPSELRRKVRFFDILESCQHFGGEQLLEEYKDLVAVTYFTIGRWKDQWCGIEWYIKN